MTKLERIAAFRTAVDMNNLDLVPEIKCNRQCGYCAECMCNKPGRPVHETTPEIAVYNALADAGDQGLPLASLARLVGAKRAGELLTVMGRGYDIERSNGRFYLRDV